MHRVIIVFMSLSIMSCAQISGFKYGGQPNVDWSIATSSGVTQGEVAGASADVVAWDDIPYAQPPVGELRWRAPRAIDVSEALIVTKEVTSCVQKASDYAGASGSGIVGSEDCLYLDIKAPSDFRSRKYPVMFWIHGGGNTSGLKDYYDYTKLVSDRGVVVVSTNYRLGALGWFTHPSIQDVQQGLDKTSNFGTLDIIESLRWVQRNIESFGGDPSNVTIFGESAGGHNVYALLVSPLSDGLFHRAISQSGYTSSHSLKDAYNENADNSIIERGSWQIINEFIDDREDQSTLRDRLKSMSARDLVALYYSKNGIDSIPLTTRDGIVIPEIGIIAGLGDAKYSKNVPVIAGANKDEVSLWHGLHRYFVEVDYPLTKLLPPVVTLKDPDLFKIWVRTRSHAWKLRGVDIPLSALEAAGYDNLYAYRFDWDHQKSSMFVDFPNIIGAAHGTDISFVTGEYKFGPISSYIFPKGPERDQMESTIMSAWSNFSKNGTPDSDLPLDWPAFGSSDPIFLHLDKDDLLRTATEKDSMDSLLEKVRLSDVPSDLQKCMIIWESLINIGDPDLDSLASWENGLCDGFDMLQEQKDIQKRLIAQYGTIGIN